MSAGSNVVKIKEEVIDDLEDAIANFREWIERNGIKGFTLTVVGDEDNAKEWWAYEGVKERLSLYAMNRKVADDIMDSATNILPIEGE